MGSQTLTSTATMARVNLLPPEIAERAKARKSQVLMVATVAAAVGAMGAFYVMKVNDVSNARQEVADAKTAESRLQADLAKYNNVRQIIAQREAAERALSVAMGRQILWSSYLNNIGLSIPDNVWLRELTIKETLDGTGPGAVPPTAQAGVFDNGYGSVTFKGTAFEYNDVASWLESIARIKGWNNSFATLAEEKWTEDRARILVEFESSVNLTPASLSGKYNKPAGS